MPEIRTHREGTLRWVQASGTGGWATASAPLSGLIGYVQAGFDFIQANKYETIKDRGFPKHHKLVETEAGEIAFTVLYGITADYPVIATASGASTPQVHLEFKISAVEYGAASAQYFQFDNAVELQRKFTEEPVGDKYAFSYRFITATGPTGSGYLS